MPTRGTIERKTKAAVDETLRHANQYKTFLFVECFRQPDTVNNNKNVRKSGGITHFTVKALPYARQPRA